MHGASSQLSSCRILQGLGASAEQLQDQDGWTPHADARSRAHGRDEIKIARSAQGKKMRIGEGGSGTVYKALMHGCDEVAVKVVRTAQPAPEEAASFQKEVLVLPPAVYMAMIRPGPCLLAMLMPIHV